MLGAILFLSPVTVRLSFALCFMGFCWLVFSDGRDATVAPLHCGLEEHWSGSWESWDLFQTLPLVCLERGQSISFVWALCFLLEGWDRIPGASSSAFRD